MGGFGWILQGGVVQIDLDYVVVSGFYCFLDGGWYFMCFVMIEINVIFVIIYYGQCGESEDMVIFYGFGDVVNLNQFFDVVFVVFLFVVCYNLEFQFVFMSGISQCFYMVVVFEVRMIECYLGDVGCFGVFGDQLINFFGCIDVVGGIFVQVFVQG